MTKVKQTRHGERLEVLTDPSKLLVKHEHDRFFIDYPNMVFRCTKCNKEIKITPKNLKQLKEVKDLENAKK